MSAFRKFASRLARALAPWLALALPGVAVAQTPERVDISPSLFGMIYRPQGQGPFPAVVAMHGCSGLGNSRTPVSDRHAEWGAALAARGFIVLFPDSFRSRGLGSPRLTACSVRSAPTSCALRASTRCCSCSREEDDDCLAGPLLCSGALRSGRPCVHIFCAPQAVCLDGLQCVLEHGSG